MGDDAPLPGLVPGQNQSPGETESLDVGTTRCLTAMRFGRPIMATTTLVAQQSRLPGLGRNPSNWANNQRRRARAKRAKVACPPLPLTICWQPRWSSRVLAWPWTMRGWAFWPRLVLASQQAPIKVERPVPKDLGDPPFNCSTPVRPMKASWPGWIALRRFDPMTPKTAACWSADGWT